MGITISGENNNDRILASDGVIDSLSGFNVVGVITATSFTGDLTGDVTGNLTGNVTGNINNTTLLLQTGGNERARILSGGAVVVAGTTAYSDGTFGEAKLQFNTKTGNHIGACSVADSTNSITHVLFKNPNGAIASVGTHNSDFIALTGNNERLRITSGGRIGIKETSPDWALHITEGSENARIKIERTNTHGVAGVIFKNTIREHHIQTNGSNFDLFDQTAQATRIRITSDGRVFIGETSVLGSAKLVVGNGGAENFEFTPGSSTYNGGLLEYIHRGDGNTRPDMNMYIAGAGAFKVYTSGANERLRITSGGLVGIGTHTVLDDTKVHILDSTTTNYRSVAIDSYATNGSTLIYKQNGSQVLAIGSGGGNVLSGSNITHGLIRSEVATVFAVGNNETLRIASNGKIHVKGNGGDSSTDFSDTGTFFNLKHDTYGGRIGFSNGTASQGVALAELFGYWGSNKVTGWVMNAGGDATNRDDGQMSFYTRKSGEAAKERFHIGSEGQIVAGYRVGTSTVRSNQPVAFHSARVSPDANPRKVSTGQRCNLFVGSNSGWAAGDGGVLGLGGSETGNPGVDAMWSYLKGSRQSGNGWEYAGYFELGTSPWSGLNMAKRIKVWADGQIEVYPTDNTFFSTQIGGAQRMKITHTGGGNVSITNSNGNMTYGSTSDYRLKKNETAITNALSTVKALKPYQFTWKNDDKLGQGFLAHEAQAVLPDIGVVSGTKDEVQTEDPVRDEHHTKGDPIYQSIDYAKLVPLLTAALQEETAKREALEARVVALESS